MSAPERFQVGDTVRCVKAAGGMLIEGRTYTIKGTLGGSAWLKVKGGKGHYWDASRFAPVYPTPPTLFATGPTARPTDPATSLQAPTGDTLTRLQAVVMDTHRAHPDGLTDQELRRHLPQFDGGSLVKRRTELARAGLVFDTGTTRETNSGRRAIVWRVQP